MATMYSFAQDWTYDLFIEDCNKYKATPMKGVHCRADADYREYFMVYIKGMVRDFREKWGSTHKGDYDRYDGYIGDSFSNNWFWDFFSDFYKDAYGQRPHLPRWFYIYPLGLPMNEDTARTFCADPIEDAVESAREARECF